MKSGSSKTIHAYKFCRLSWVVILTALFGCHDVLSNFGLKSYKMEVTFLHDHRCVDWEVKHQFQQMK